MKKGLLTSAALILAGSLAFTSAFTQDAPGVKKDQAKSAGSSASNTAENAKPKRTAARRVPKIDPADGKQISPYTLAERTANAKKDCAPGIGTHGVYRGYSQWDPELKSIEGRKLFEACIKRGLEPAPWFAVHRTAYAIGIQSVFGKTKEDCLKCHSKGY
jgi:hypothetical protein